MPASAETSAALMVEGVLVRDEACTEKGLEELALKRDADLRRRDLNGNEDGEIADEEEADEEESGNKLWNRMPAMEDIIIM